MPLNLSTCILLPPAIPPRDLVWCGIHMQPDTAHRLCIYDKLWMDPSRGVDIANPTDTYSMSALVVIKA